MRVIYYFHSERMPLYLLAAFGKNEKANLSSEEQGLLAKAVRELVISWRQKMGKAFTEISAGLKDAADHAKGETSGVVEHTPETLNVKAIRKKTGMSQERFCATFGISLGARRH
jgi:DNA-binding transcriptional regulator YiaG